jgi:hypothetical protein
MDYRNWPPDNDGIPPNTPEKVTPRKSFVRRFIWQIVAIVSVVLVIFLAYSNITMRFAPKNTAVVPVPTSQSGQQTPTAIPATPTPTTDTTNANNSSTPTTTPIVPVQTGLPCKVNLSTWTDGSADWKILNSTLLNDGTGNWNNQGPTIVTPCQLGSTANYAVEAQIQVVSTSSYPCFGITVRGTPLSNSWQGYKAGVGNCSNGLSIARISGSDYNYDQAKKDATFDPTTTKHTYRVEARNNTITFFIDGGQILTMNDNRYLTGAEVGLWSQGTQLEVFSLQVVAL